MTVLKQHLCSFLFVILNSNFFFNNARIENFNGYEFRFTGFIIFVLRDTQRKSTVTEKQVFIHSLFYYNIFFETECNDYALINNTFKR